MPNPSLILLSRPLYLQLAEAFTALLRRVASAARERAERRRAERQIETLAEMDATLLRDIGAPAWMVNRAAERRDAQEMRLFELQFSRDIDRLHGLK
ncbi:MAG TPA: hypothetical protein VF169_23225 [Albitalea sp.]|uniref:hypothetical protein n=1 Tax=Piscinibacter sp. TaxID=1903157 RepID=UPI002ED450EB